MWWRQRRSTCSSPEAARRSRRARRSGPAARSKGRRASAVARRRTSLSRVPGGRAARSIDGSAAGTSPAGRTTCAGSSPASRKTVRNTSCRRTTSPRLQARAEIAQGPRQPDGRRHVVGGARRLELMEEPEALLAERERQPAVPCHPDERRRGNSGARRPRRFDPDRQPGDRRRLEKRAKRQLDAEDVAHLRHHPGRHQRLPA